MSESALKEHIEPYPGIRGFIFVPPATGRSRTWIFGAAEAPQMVLDFHFSSLITQGWSVIKNTPAIVAERGGAGISVSASRQKEETRIVYELYDKTGDRE